VRRSRAYANLFVLFATTYGAGDGSTTFNIPDLRGYLLGGRDDMGGVAASRITVSGSGISGATLGAAGGAETVTLTTGQMPAHNHTLNDAGHDHAVVDPAHSHGYNSPLIAGVLSVTGGGATTMGGVAQTGGTTTGISINPNTTGISINNTGGGGAHQNMPPTRICNFIMRIL